MLKRALLALAALPLCILAAESPVEQFVALANSSPDGVIRLNEQLFDLLSAPKRNWSAVIQFTALGKNMRCTPCKYVSSSL